MPSPTQSLTVFLGRPGLAAPDDFLHNEARQAADAYPLQARGGISGTVYVPQTRRSTPAWVAFLNQGLAQPLPPLQANGVSAVMVAQYDQRLFAFTFGHAGRNMLQAGAYELDFGLKVVLNRVDPKLLRSVDCKNFDDSMVISTRKQTSRSSELGSFALDISRDLLRGVVGDPTDKTYFKRLAGADALAFTTELGFADLGDICEELLAAYQDQRYRQHFDWVDRVKQVRDRTLVATLDRLLLQAIHAGQVGCMHLAPADVVEWEKIEHFSFRGSGKRQVCTYPELTLDGYLDSMGPAKVVALDADDLRQHAVLVKYNHLVDPVAEFSVYDCLVWDIAHQGEHFALMDGRWFGIETNFAQRIVREAAALHQPGAYLIPATPGQREEDFNLEVVRQQRADYALLDQKPIKTANMATEVECCDLFSRQGEFIHVKKRSASATLSHLFSQGSVAAELFMQEAEFRDKVRDQLRQDRRRTHAALIPAARPEPSRYKVIYAMIARHDARGQPPPLPFFSAVNLVQHYQRLQRLGLAVEVRYIPLQ